MELVLRCRITFGVAVIVGNLVYHRVPLSPEEAFVWRMAVGRPVPVTVLGTETVWRAILMPLVVFGLKAVHRAIVVRGTPGMICPAAVPVKSGNRRFIPFLKVAATVTVAVKFWNRRFFPSPKIVAAILVARAASFALGP